jgi:hypothetical protein
MMGLTATSPSCTVEDNRVAAEDQGEATRDHFERAVSHLADELARHDPVTRDKLRIGWDALRAIPLFVYDQPPLIHVRDEAIAPGVMKVRLKALLNETPLEFHVCEDAIADREHGGRAIASLFPPEVRRKIDVEWLAAWLAGKTAPAAGLKLASDEELLDTLNEEAERINAAPKTKIKISPPAGRTGGAKPRTLKETIGVIATAAAETGSPPKNQPPEKPNLGDEPPPPSAPPPPGTGPAPRTFSSLDLEQAGWEVLKQVLSTADGKELVDFRKRHGVGADGAFAWEKFVELKATGRGPATSVELSTTEYLRAKDAGIDFILALVSGLESGEVGQVRLIFDPANRASCKPTSGMRFYALNEAPAIVVTFDEGAPVPEASMALD